MSKWYASCIILRLEKRKGTWKLEEFTHWRTRRDQLPAFAGDDDERAAKTLGMTRGMEPIVETWQCRNTNNVLGKRGHQDDLWRDETEASGKIFGQPRHTRMDNCEFLLEKSGLEGKATIECVWRVILSSTDACDKGALENGHWSGQCGCRMDERRPPQDFWRFAHATNVFTASRKCVAVQFTRQWLESSRRVERVGSGRMSSLAALQCKWQWTFWCVRKAIERHGDAAPLLWWCVTSPCLTENRIWYTDVSLTPS